MDIRAFSNPNGRFTTGGNHVTFLPNPLPPTLYYDSRLTALIASSHAKLGELSGVGQRLPNPRLLITPYLRREAVLSSRIEGTQASLADLFMYEVSKDDTLDSPIKRLREVRNYVRSLEECLRRIEGGGRITLGLVKDGHKMLLRRVRGAEHNPGQFRTVQNWIGSPDSPIEDAVYVPPAPEHLREALSNFEEFLAHPPADMPILVQCAVLHYQFEAIHPFTDGNGRLGRLLIPLLLCERKALAQPLLYVSAYLERNRTDYYDRLLAVSQTSDWRSWLVFFLTAVKVQASEAISGAQKLLALKDTWKDLLRKEGATMNAQSLMEKLFVNPYTTATNASEYLDVSFATAQAAIKTLVRLEILRPISTGRRNRMYVARQISRVLT